MVHPPWPHPTVRHRRRRRHPPARRRRRTGGSRRADHHRQRRSDHDRRRSGGHERGQPIQPIRRPARVPEGVPAAGDDTTVTRVIDGDTIEVAGATRVRLIGVDTPETVEPGTPVQCFGPEATRYAGEITPPGTRVRLVYDVQRTDPFGRTLAYVYKLDDGLFVNRAIARNGFALQLTVPPNVAHAEEFRLAVAEARNAGLGLWRSCHSTTTAASAPTVTTPPTILVVPSTRSSVATATPCRATVSNASPTRNATVTVRITSDYPNAATVATAHYKTTDTTNRSTTDGSGAGTIDFRISSATPGFEVVIDVTVAGASPCQTSFTPLA